MPGEDGFQVGEALVGVWLGWRGWAGFAGDLPVDGEPDRAADLRLAVGEPTAVAVCAPVV